MFKPDSVGTAMPLLVLSLVCWGSWGNTSKLAGNFPFPFFYTCYAISCFTTCTVLGLVFGNEDYFPSHQGDKEDFVGNLKLASMEHILAALGAGTVFNVANVLLVVAIELAGLSMAFPVGIGTSLAMGTILTWVVQPGETDVLLLFVGVGLALVAVCAMALSHHIKESSAGAPGSQIDNFEELLADKPEGYTQSKGGMSSMQRLLLLCVVSGVLMGSWSPLSAASTKSDVGLNAYTCMFYFSLAALVTTFPIMLVLMKKPYNREEPVAMSEFFGHGCAPLYAALGGAIWALGTVVNLVSGEQVSFAVSYSIGQSAPMVAAFWGVCVFKEFKGAPTMSWALMGAMFLFYIGAITCIALSAGSDSDSSGGTNSTNTTNTTFFV